MRRRLRKPPGGSASVPLFWEGYSTVPQATMDEISTAFGGAALVPPTPPTINPANYVEVSDETGFHAVADGDGSSIETQIHIIASFSAVDVRINASNVLVTTAPGVDIDSTPAVDTFGLGNVEFVEWDGGNYPLAMRCTIRGGIGGNNTVVPENVVFRRCNIHRAAGNPCTDRRLSYSAYVECRFFAPWGVLAYAPAAGQVMTDVFILNCTMESDDLGGTDRIIELQHADDATELTRIVVWNTHTESDGSGDEYVLGRCSNVAVVDSVIRGESIVHDTGIGSGIYWWRNELYTTTVPTGTAEPAAWQWIDNTWYGVSQAAFEAAMGTTNLTSSGNSWEASQAAPDWQLPESVDNANAPGDPALTLGLGGTMALGAACLNVWMVPPEDPYAGGGGPLLTLDGSNASQLDDFGGAGADNMAQATAGQRPAWRTSGGQDDRPYFEAQDTGRVMLCNPSIGNPNRTAIIVVGYVSAAERRLIRDVNVGASHIIIERGASGGFQFFARDTGGALNAAVATTPAGDSNWHAFVFQPRATGWVTEVDEVGINPDFSDTDALAAIDSARLFSNQANSGGGIALRAHVDTMDDARKAVTMRFVRENYPTLL